MIAEGEVGVTSTARSFRRSAGWLVRRDRAPARRSAHGDDHARTDLDLLALERDDFIAAVTGHAPSAEAAGAVVGAAWPRGRRWRRCERRPRDDLLMGDWLALHEAAEQRRRRSAERLRSSNRARRAACRASGPVQARPANDPVSAVDIVSRRGHRPAEAICATHRR